MTHRSADYHRERRKLEPELYKERDRQKYLKNAEKDKLRKKQKRRDDPKSYILTQVKSRAKRLGTEFNLEAEDIQLPTHCPILGIPLFIGDDKLCANSFSLDRVDNSKGYVKGNVRVISFKANRYKSDLTLEQVTALLSYMKSAQTD